MTTGTCNEVKIEVLAIDLIRTDGGTQMRADLDRQVYLEYRDLFLAGVELPPVDVFHGPGSDGVAAYWLSDGFHRLYGAKEAKRGSIQCNIHQGTVRDAVLFAVGANQTHGLNRTNADKRNAVLMLLNDDEWFGWSDRLIAEKVGVGHSFVTNVRNELSTVDSSPAAKRKHEPRVGRDGKVRKPPSHSELPETGASAEPGDERVGDELDQAGEPSHLAPAARLKAAPPFVERVRTHNQEVERFAKRFTDALEPFPPGNELEKKLTVIQQQVQSVCGTIRTCKVHDQPCPKCEANGTPCVVCGGSGMVTKMTYDGMGGK